MIVQRLLGVVGLVLSAGLAGCAGTPPPDWQVSSHGAMERAVAAYLGGNGRVEALEFDRARAEIARTGRADLLARVELVRCATRVASLVFEACTGYSRLQPDASAAEQAYARYLGAQGLPGDPELLPAPHRPISTMLLRRPSGDDPSGRLRDIADPLSRLVAAGVLLQAGLASPATLELAVDTASAQGWNRPLLAWLRAQARLAEQAGAQEAAAKLRRRIELVLQAPGAGIKAD